MGKTLYVTDFDDTLAKTDAKIYLTKKNGKEVTLTPGQYASYDAEDGDRFDFSDFEVLSNPRPINRFVNLLKKVLDEKKAHKVTVLTARGHTKPIKTFLEMMGIKGNVTIAALGNADPQLKAKYIEKHINDGYDRIAFIDDSEKNIQAVNNLHKKYPEVKILAHQVKPSETSTEQPTSSSKSKVEIRPIGKKDAEFPQADEWIRKHHYLKKWPKAVQSTLGVYVDDKLSGVLVYGIGTRGQAATDIFGAGVISNNQLWDLQRAFTTDEAKKLVPNLGSMVISRGNEYIRTKAKTKDGKPIKAIVSYADSAQGHKGSVYQSTNATYLGEQPPRTGWAITDPKTGNTVMKSVVAKSILKQLADTGYVIEKVTPETGKHKFIYSLGKDQTERDQLTAKIVKPIFDYPKTGAPPKQIENPAKHKLMAKNPQRDTQSQPDAQKGSVIRRLLKSKVKNPETGHDILVKTALSYDKMHPSYRQAMGMVKAYAKKHNIRIKQTR